MISGVILGLSRLIAYFSLTSSGLSCPRHGFLWLICSDFNLFAIILSFIVAIITVLSSILTKPPMRSEVHQHIYHYPKWCCSYCLNADEHIGLNENEPEIDISAPKSEIESQTGNGRRTDFVGIDTDSEDSSSSVPLDREQPEGKTFCFF